MSQLIRNAFYISLNSHDNQTLSLSLVQKHNSREEQLAQGLIKIVDYEKLLKQFKTDYFYRGTPDLESLGETLYQFLDGPLDFGRHLDTTRQQIVFFDANKALGQLPWEILHNGSSFLINRRGYHYYPIRLAAGNSTEEITTQNRSLNALFMAASPEGTTELDYEQEEAKLTQATEHTHVYLDIEDSGTLAGIEERLTAHYEPYDVLHITGHATIQTTTQTTHSSDNQGAFILENELGQPSSTSVDELYDVIAESERQPKLVFLSGCSTAQAHRPETEELKSVESMAQALADCGINAVLGWFKNINNRYFLDVGAHVRSFVNSMSYFKTVEQTE